MDVTSSRGFAVQRGIHSSACFDIDNLLDPELKRRLGEPLERPLRAARFQRPNEAKVMSEVYARIPKTVERLCCKTFGVRTVTSAFYLCSARQPGA